MSEDPTCPNCGAEVAESGSTCPECGRDLGEGDAPNQEDGPLEDEEQEGRPAIAFALLAGLIMAVAVVTAVIIGATHWLIPFIVDEDQSMSVEQSAENTLEAEQAYSRGVEAFNQQQWSAARRAFEHVLELAPDHAEARTHLTRTEAEQDAQAALEEARSAVAQGRLREASTALNRISAESAYAMEATSVRLQIEDRQGDAGVSADAQ